MISENQQIYLIKLQSIFSSAFFIVSAAAVEHEIAGCIISTHNFPIMIFAFCKWIFLLKWKICLLAFLTHKFLNEMKTQINSSNGNENKQFEFYWMRFISSDSFRNKFNGTINIQKKIHEHFLVRVK